MHCFRMSGLLSASQTFSLEAGMRWLSFICMFVLTSFGIALAARALDGDLGEDRHRDFFRRDGAEIEPGRRLDAIDRRRVEAGGDQLVAQRRHLAAAAGQRVRGGPGWER